MSHLQQPSTKLRDHENNGGFMDTSQQQSSSTSTKSFVGKVRSTLSKWFNTPNNRNKVAVRPRNAMEANDSSNNDSDDDSEDNLIEQQQKQPKTVLPQAKRLKATTTTCNELTNIYANNNTQLRLFSQIGERNPKRLILNRRSNAVKLMHQTQDNTRESDSEGSTGGYFSMSYIAQGHKPEETEQTDVNGQEEDSTSARIPPTSSTMINPHNRSLFDTSHDRSLFTNLQSTVNTSLRKVSGVARPASLSMRRPAFSGANLTNTATSVEATNNSGGRLLDRTIATRKIYNSPFYSGRTLYGGASNATIGRLRLPRHANNAVVVETSRETDATSSNMLSSTARRILDTLESYTLDSTQRKLINQSTNRRRQLTQDHLFRIHKPYNRTTPNNNQCKLDDLQVPNVAQLLKMKERLQTQTVQVRQMIKESNQRQTSDTGVGGKMRTKVTAQVRQRKQLHDTEPMIENDSTELERLSSIQLPISALPKFTDLQLPVSKPVTLSSGSANTIDITVVTTVPPITAVTPSATSSDSVAPSAIHCKYSAAIFDTKVTATVTPPPIGSTTLKPVIDKKRDDQIFVFAKPLVLLDSGLNGSKLRNLTAINNFKFSVPLNQKLIHKLKHQKKSSADNVDSTAESKSIVTKPLLSRTIVASLASSSENKRSSLILPQMTTAATGFGNIFKLSASSQWECDVCLVRNPSTALMCLACTSPKVQQMKTIAPVTTVSAANVATSSIGWGGTIFQPPSNKWECDVCLVSNSNRSTRCAACETPKPGNSSAIKTATTTSGASAATWECPSCMVKNLTSVQKCVCCETLKPGSNIGNTSSSSLTTNKFMFGISPIAPAATSTTTITVSDEFIFGLPPPKQQPLATIQTTSSVISTTTSAGSASVTTVVDSKSSTTLTGFTFGIPVTNAPAAITINGGSGGNSSSAVSSTTTLNQKPLPNGMISSSSSSSATPSVQTPVNATVAIKFGVPTTTASGLFAIGRPAATFTPSPVAVGQHVSSSTSTINDSNKTHVSPLETNSASGFSSSGAVSSTAAVANSGGFQATAKTTAAAAVPTIQTFSAFPIGNKAQLSAAPIPTSTIVTTAPVTIIASQAPVFSFGSAAASTSNSAPSNGPFVFGGSATSAAPAAVQPPAAPTGLFNFRSTTMTTAPPNVTLSGFGFGAAAAATATATVPAAISFGGGAAASNMFGQLKTNNGNFDFSSSIGAGKPFQVVSASSAPALPSSGGFNFAPQNAVTPGSGGFFSFGSTAPPVGSGSNNAAPSVVAAAAPFTFGTVSSSSSSAAGTNGANKPTGAPLSFGGITSSSTPTISSQAAPRTNMFGTPTLSVASLADNSANGGSQVLQQRRIIRKAVRRTNMQPR